MKRLITGVGKVELPISNESGGSQFGILNPQERSEIICVLAVDLSLRSPGFAQIQYDPKAGKITSVTKGHIESNDNVTHGEKLCRIYNALSGLIPSADVLVREKGFSRFPRETQALFKVVGVSDLAAWRCGEMTFCEIAPTTVKKILTGSGKASKQDVADALLPYVGHQKYACDDESDAMAVGVAWLLLMAGDHEDPHSDREDVVE